MNQVSLARLTVITALVFMALEPVRAQAYDRNTRYNCARQRMQELVRAGDPRIARQVGKIMAASRDPAVRQGMVAYHVNNTADGRSVTRSLDRYCAARGQ
jgi:hypothetical protein